MNLDRNGKIAQLPKHVREDPGLLLHRHARVRAAALHIRGPITSSSSLEFLDDFYLATTSPCRGAGSALFASGTDINGLPWAEPSRAWAAARSRCD